jgi:hypothetical protein
MGWDVNPKEAAKIKIKNNWQKEEEETRNQSVQDVLGQNKQTLAALQRKHKKQCEENHIYIWNNDTELQNTTQK